MADITMCEGIGCPWKTGCKRFTDKPNEHRQPYFSESPGKMVEEYFTCDMFWTNSCEDIFNQLKDICKPKGTMD